MGFKELPHTADWSLRVWARDLPELFAEAARGMNALMGARLAPGPRTPRTFESAAPEPESLLVAFLSELVYCAEQEKVGFEEFKVEIEGQRLKVGMNAATLVSVNKAIKAVTYHNLQVRQTERGCEVEIVFDV